MASGGTDDNEVTIRTTGLTPQKTYDILIVAEFDGRKFFLDGFDFTTDASGVLVTYPIVAEDPHMKIAWVVSDDTTATAAGT